VADLQEIVDDLEAEIRRPISVEDRRWRLLAHSAQPDEADAVRRSSILTRETSPQVAAWLNGLGLQRARDLVDVPRNEELGMIRRGCLPIRRGDVLLGFLWVIVGDRPLSETERAGLERGGEEVAANLWARHRAADERRRRTIELLEKLFAGDPLAPRELAATLRWPEHGSFAVVVCEGDEAVAERLRRSRAAHDVAYLEDAGRLTILVRDPALLQNALNVRNGGVSSPFKPLGGAPGARDQAEISALCARAQPSLGPVAAYDELGSWALIASLWTDAHHPQPPAPIVALAHHRRGEQLLEALEGLLEHGGDVADAAKQLSMHRATLYRRLQRVEEITGLDLEKGDDRLLAHVGLRLHRLNATVVAPPPR
jgi:ribosomal protein L30/L7E